MEIAAKVLTKPLNLLLKFAYNKFIEKVAPTYLSEEIVKSLTPALKKLNEEITKLKYAPFCLANERMENAMVHLKINIYHPDAKKPLTKCEVKAMEAFSMVDNNHKVDCIQLAVISKILLWLNGSTATENYNESARTLKGICNHYLEKLHMDVVEKEVKDMNKFQMTAKWDALHSSFSLNVQIITFVKYLETKPIPTEQAINKASENFALITQTRDKNVEDSYEYLSITASASMVRMFEVINKNGGTWVNVIINEMKTLAHDFIERENILLLNILIDLVSRLKNTFFKEKQLEEVWGILRESGKSGEESGEESKRSFLKEAVELMIWYYDKYGGQYGGSCNLDNFRRYKKAYCKETNNNHINEFYQRILDAYKTSMGKVLTIPLELVLTFAYSKLSENEAPTILDEETVEGLKPTLDKLQDGIGNFKLQDLISATGRIDHAIRCLREDLNHEAAKRELEYCEVYAMQALGVVPNNKKLECIKLASMSKILLWINHSGSADDDRLTSDIIMACKNYLDALHHKVLEKVLEKRMRKFPKTFKFGKNEWYELWHIFSLNIQIIIFVNLFLAKNVEESCEYLSIAHSASMEKMFKMIITKKKTTGIIYEMKRLANDFVKTGHIFFLNILMDLLNRLKDNFFKENQIDEVWRILRESGKSDEKSGAESQFLPRCESGEKFKRLFLCGAVNMMIKCYEKDVGKYYNKTESFEELYYYHDEPTTFQEVDYYYNDTTSFIRYTIAYYNETNNNNIRDNITEFYQRIFNIYNAKYSYKLLTGVSRKGTYSCSNNDWDVKEMERIFTSYNNGTLHNPVKLRALWFQCSFPYPDTAFQFEIKYTGSYEKLELQGCDDLTSADSEPMTWNVLWQCAEAQENGEKCGEGRLLKQIITAFRRCKNYRFRFFGCTMERIYFIKLHFPELIKSNVRYLE